MKLSKPSSFTRTGKDFITNVLIVGGSYAGLSAVKAFKKTMIERIAATKTSGLDTEFKKISITLLEPRAGLLNVLGIPKAIVDSEFAKTQFVPFHQLLSLTFDNTISTNDKVYEDITRAHNEQPDSNLDIGLEFTYIQGKVEHVSETSATYKLVDEGEESKEHFSIGFDYVVLACGRDRSWPVTPDAYNLDSFMGEMEKARNEIVLAEKISIIGAGAVGVEVAADIKHKYPNKSVSLIHPHPTFPAEPLTADFKEVLQKSLVDAGIDLHLSTRIDKELPNGDLLTTENKIIATELTHWCTSHKNNTHVLSESLQKLFVTPQNNVIVNDYLQVTNTLTTVPQVFVIGDLVELPIIKSAGWAMYMGRAVASNISSLILENTLVEPFPDLTKMPLGMVLVGGDGVIVSELAGEVELNNAYYVEEYKDYCIGRVRATMDV